jgi:aryl-alcohol dehydrogenase-like predicted oxidoreductase
MSDCPRVELAPGYWISRIINGCWQLAPDHGGGPGSSSDALRVFGELVDKGFTTFDCADIYTGTEEALGRFRRNLADPDRIQIHTKYVPNRDHLSKLSAKKVDAAIDGSLSRLGVEQIDLLQFHWWDYDVPGLDVMLERLSRALEAGKIRHVGATNFNSQYVRRIADSGLPLVSLQAQYSLLDRRPEKDFPDTGDSRRIRLLPYGVLAGGFLTDRYYRMAAPRDMNRSLRKYRLIIDEVGGWQVFQDLLGVLSAIARKHGTSIGAIAARWVLDRPRVAAIILGTGTEPHIAENLALAGLRLDDEDRQRIAQYLRAQAVPPGDMYDLERDPDGPHAQLIRMNLNVEAGTS